MSHIKVVLLSNVVASNVDAFGDLQAGDYNVAYNGVMSMMPEYRRFDGVNWEGFEKWTRLADDYNQDRQETASIMTVFLRVGD